LDWKKSGVSKRERGRKTKKGEVFLSGASRGGKKNRGSNRPSEVERLNELRRKKTKSVQDPSGACRSVKGRGIGGNENLKTTSVLGAWEGTADAHR